MCHRTLEGWQAVSRTLRLWLVRDISRTGEASMSARSAGSYA
jgi:hypothetical protein